MYICIYIYLYRYISIYMYMYVCIYIYIRGEREREMLEKTNSAQYSAPNLVAGTNFGYDVQV